MYIRMFSPPLHLHAADETKSSVIDDFFCHCGNFFVLRMTPSSHCPLLCRNVFTFIVFVFHQAAFTLILIPYINTRGGASKLFSFTFTFYFTFSLRFPEPFYSLQ